jgi:hypothetical protein
VGAVGRQALIVPRSRPWVAAALAISLGAFVPFAVAMENGVRDRGPWWFPAMIAGAFLGIAAFPAGVEAFERARQENAPILGATTLVVSLAAFTTATLLGGLILLIQILRGGWSPMN